MDKMPNWTWVQDLFRLGQDAVLGENFASAAEPLLQHIALDFNASNCSLAICSGNHTKLTVVAGIDLPPQAIGQDILWGEGILGHVVAQGVPLLINGNSLHEPRFWSWSNDRKNRPSSALCWPLKTRTGIMGAMSISRTKNTPPFTQQDLEEGEMVVNLIALVVENIRLHRQKEEHIVSLSKLNGELKETNRCLEDLHTQLLQSEKMAAVGQLAAGVAHEINNPIGYVSSNLGTLCEYQDFFFSILDAYEGAEAGLKTPQVQDAFGQVRALKDRLDYAFLREDARDLIKESGEGINRVKQIIQDLKDFSRADQGEWQWADLNKGIQSTLNVVWNEIKYKAQVIKEYGELPQVQCFPSQLNQVFMNLLVNAAHAISERGTITIRSGEKGDKVWMEVADTGQGIPPKILNRIFEPFFTTKPVGKGTGLGLSVSYNIVQKHHGWIEVQSEEGKGTRFRVWLPINQENAGDNLLDSGILDSSACSYPV